MAQYSIVPLQKYNVALYNAILNICPCDIYDDIIQEINYDAHTPLTAKGIERSLNFIGKDIITQ